VRVRARSPCPGCIYRSKRLICGFCRYEGLSVKSQNRSLLVAQWSVEQFQIVSVIDKRLKFRRTEWQKTGDRNEAIDARTYARSAAAVYGMDRFNDGVWSGLEDRLKEMSKSVSQPPVPAPPAGPPQRTIRGRFFTNDPPPRRW
jgi:phage terminase large subunit GpA-like protein